MADFNFVTERLATGAAIASTADVTQLMVAGITHVIDCREEFNDAPLLAPNFAYLWDGTFDDGLPKPPTWFKPGIDFALSALDQPKNKVYIHCAAGINRGPSMTYAVLLAFGIDAKTAEAMIRTARPQVGLAYKADANKAVVSLGYVSVV